MVKIFVFFLSLFLICACSLSADQEKKLNESLSIYLNARNNCLPVSIVAYTYPSLVKSIKEKGDSTFKARFDCVQDSLDFQDPTIKEIEKKLNQVHVLYELDVYNTLNFSFNKHKHQLIAISDDKGKSWFFLDKTDYVNKTVLPDLKRLIK